MTGVSERTVKVSRMNTPCRETATRGSQVHLRRLGSKGKGPRGLGRLAMQDRRIDLLLGKRGRVLDQVLSILLRHPAFRTNGELCFKVAAVPQLPIQHVADNMCMSQFPSPVFGERFL